MSGKKVLITGAAGFLGWHLARLHAARGDRLTLVDNLARGETDHEWKQLLAGGDVRFYAADLTSPQAWSRLDSGHDYVYHLAAVNGTETFYQRPHDVLRVNLLTTIHALDWFRGNPAGGKLLFTSSNETYAGALEAFGRLPIPTPENVPLVVADVTNPRWSYAGSKLAGEQLCLHYAWAYDLRVAVVRPHNVYGPRAGYEHVIPQLIQRILTRVDPFPVYGASDTRSFCYVEDAVLGLHAVMESPRTDGDILHIGAATETVIADLTEELFTVAGWRPRMIRHEPAPAGSVKRRQPDVTRIHETVGWRACTSLATGLRRTFAWYRDRLGAPR